MRLALHALNTIAALLLVGAFGLFLMILRSGASASPMAPVAVKIFLFALPLATITFTVFVGWGALAREDWPAALVRAGAIAAPIALLACLGWTSYWMEVTFRREMEDAVPMMVIAGFTAAGLMTLAVAANTWLLVTRAYWGRVVG
jgi:hypothetical protein